MSEGLRERLDRAERERDDALQRLGLARAELDALRLALQSKGEPEPPLYPSTAVAGAPPPLRYVAVDKLNDTLKRLVRRVRGGHER